jgi:transcriptional regulator with XRE-family HTH domain
MASREQKPPIDHPLRDWRLARGLSLSAAAARIGTHKSVWHAWENGYRRPNATFMPRIRELTGGVINADVFFPDEDAA